VTVPTRPVDYSWNRFRGDFGNVGDMGDSTATQQLTAHEMRTVAVKALCDDRSVRKYLDGKPVRDLLRMRIERALRECGFEAAVRAEAVS